MFSVKLLRLIVAIGGISIFITAGVMFGVSLFLQKNSLPAQYFHEHATTSHTVPSFEHIFLVVEENHTYRSIIGNTNAPFVNKLAHSYSSATRYYATAHPSLPNYLELTSGTHAAITNDCNPPGGACLADVKNIADRVQSSGRSWKEYADSMPRPCTTHNTGNYVTKHNPFVYYPDILYNKSRCDSHVVPFSRLSSDIQNKTLPNLAFITPNVCHDMHSCSIATGDRWLSQAITPLLKSYAFTNQNSLLIVTWDEGTLTNQRVPAIVAGPDVKKGFVSKRTYSHYSILHTIEAAWHLRPLTTQDAAAPIMSDFFVPKRSS